MKDLSKYYSEYNGIHDHVAALYVALSHIAAVGSLIVAVALSVILVALKAGLGPLWLIPAAFAVAAVIFRLYASHIEYDDEARWLREKAAFENGTLEELYKLEELCKTETEAKAD